MLDTFTFTDAIMTTCHRLYNKKCMEPVTPIGLWNTVLKPRVWHYCCRHLGLLEPEVAIFGRDGEALEDRYCYASILSGSD